MRKHNDHGTNSVLNISVEEISGLKRHANFIKIQNETRKESIEK